VGLSGEPLEIVHRDVSPHNMFVTYDGQVKVLDFGVAKAADSTIDTKTGVIKGKMSYMAPEQAARRACDRRADIFSMGVVLWQVLTGRRMWAGLSDHEIFWKLQTPDFPRPSTIVSTVPEELEAICMKALAGDKNHRFSTAAEMQARIEEFLETRG